MSLFDDSLGHEESLFQRPGVLDQEYLPRLLPYREDKQKYLAQSVKQISSGGSNYFLHGPPGVGKTASVRYVLRELKQSGQDVVPLYINCWRQDTFYKILKEMKRSLSLSLDLKELSQDELFQELVSHLTNTYQGAVLAFDEIDRAQDYSFLYNFAEELSYKSIWLISTRKEWYAQADDRIRSRLSCEMIKFAAYSKQETRGILKERRDNAFVEGVWQEAAFDKVVDECYAKKDVRVGLALMKKAGQLAEEEASREIKEEHVEQAIEANQLMKDRDEEEDKEKEEKEEDTTLSDF